MTVKVTGVGDIGCEVSVDGDRVRSGGTAATLGKNWKRILSTRWGDRYGQGLDVR